MQKSGVERTVVAEGTEGKLKLSRYHIHWAGERDVQISAINFTDLASPFNDFKRAQK